MREGLMKGSDTNEVSGCGSTDDVHECHKEINAETIRKIHMVRITKSRPNILVTWARVRVADICKAISEHITTILR